jgi:ribosomal protein S18 acetylase RimI-like enzyme
MNAAATNAESSISTLSEARREQAARVLARAFRDNPLNVAVVGTDEPARRLRCNLHGMRASLASAIRHGEALTASLDGRVAGGLIAVQPGAYPLPAPGPLGQLRCLLGQGWRAAARWGEVFESLQAHHPTAPHWYLGTLGVDPPLRRRGIGAALLRAWIERVDRSGTPAYLETDLESNLAFYERVGFENVGRIEVLGVPIWRMQRPGQVRDFDQAARAVESPSG